MEWTETIQRWRRLPVDAREQIAWDLIPRQVALSMAFEGEEVDLAWLKKLHGQVEQPDTSKLLKAS
jgi:hypothetical protein